VLPLVGELEGLEVTAGVPQRLHARVLKLAGDVVRREPGAAASGQAAFQRVASQVRHVRSEFAHRNWWRDGRGDRRGGRSAVGEPGAG